jgi:hypothetical protein
MKVLVDDEPSPITSGELFGGSVATPREKLKIH